MSISSRSKIIASKTLKGGGAFGQTKVISNDKFQKAYVEDTINTLNNKYILTINDKLLLFTQQTEYENLKHLHACMPDDFPKIYSYEETKMSNIKDKSRPYIPRPIQKRNPKLDELNYCKLVMSNINFPNVGFNYINLSSVDTLIKYKKKVRVK